MRKKIVCVFAHPDDEAFGPGGTIAKLAKKNDVYILCATKGEAGKHYNKTLQKKIATIRSKELQESAKILGVKNVYYLGFKDGTLNNNLYHNLAEKVESYFKKLKPEIILTFEPRGISGHIDHITVSLVTTYVFYKFAFIKKLYYYCISDKQRSRVGDYFIYFPPGYKKSEVDEVVDISKVWDTKIKAMYTHDSQIDDVKRILKQRENLPKEEYFLKLVKK